MLVQSLAACYRTFRAVLDNGVSRNSEIGEAANLTDGVTGLPYRPEEDGKLTPRRFTKTVKKVDAW